MADLLGEHDCPLGLLRGSVEIHLHHQHHAQHGQIRRFDTRKAVRGAKLNTAREHLSRRAEQAAHIIGIGEAAERTRLLFHRARCLRLAQGLAPDGGRGLCAQQPDRYLARAGGELGGRRQARLRIEHDPQRRARGETGQPAGQFRIVGLDGAEADQDGIVRGAQALAVGARRLAGDPFALA